MTEGRVLSHEELKERMARWRIRWSLTAGNDLQDIEDFIARDSVVHAISFIDRIVESTESLRRKSAYGLMVAEAWAMCAVKPCSNDNPFFVQGGNKLRIEQPVQDRRTYRSSPPCLFSHFVTPSDAQYGPDHPLARDTMAPQGVFLFLTLPFDTSIRSVHSAGGP